MSDAEYTPEDGRILIATARQAIAARLGQSGAAPPPTARLYERRGAFVTLRERSTGELRGCVGFVEPLFPLVDSVSRAAQAAAFEDGRFDPVSASELPGLSVEVSILGPARPIRPEDVKIGVHGLILRQGGRSGLLLPQVPIEQEWDRETFLEGLCRKAGLPHGAWKEERAELLGFTATIVEEERPHAGKDKAT
jgi:AmmeMemoRadiSam system protein A